MTTGGLILTYHAIEPGREPLCIDPALFRAHMDCIADADVAALTIAQAANGLRAGSLPDRWVAITFDDGFASVPRAAAPLLADRGLLATVFCVAGHLGGVNDWRSQPRRAPQLRLATARELTELAAQGVELASHGLAHTPLASASSGALRRELVESRSKLEQATGVAVSSFAYPYGALPAAEGLALVAETYTAACTTELRRVSGTENPFSLSRIDAHYLRSPTAMQAAVAGKLDAYLALRRTAARVRRAVRHDYVASLDSTPVG